MKLDVMRNILGIIFVCVLTITSVSCSSNDDIDQIESSFSANDCDLENSNLLVAICVNGASRVTAGQTVSFASKFRSEGSTSSATFEWNIESGSMEVLEIVNTVVDESVTKSVATIKFNSNFDGEGVIRVVAADSESKAAINHFIEIAGSE
jgi:hypothetical protein